jgi:hypothetical protein
MVGERVIRTILFALVVLAAPLHAAEWRFDDVGRVVAVSDIHGAHDALLRTLQQADVLDDDLAWVAGDTHLVIVGDIVDRGPDSRRSLDLLMRLEGEAEAAGGRVHVLIGNHEAMVLTGDLRYVSRQEYAAFAAEEKPEDREYWAMQFAAKRNGDVAAPEEQRRRFDERYPAGYFAYREAFSPDGAYGSWLLSKPIMIVINGTAFVHGGVSPMIAELRLDGVNRLVATQLRGYIDSVEELVEAGLLLPTDAYFEHERLARSLAATLSADERVARAVEVVSEFENSALQALDGPLWYRGNAACNAIIEVERLEVALDAIDADRVVIGHTPTDNRQVLERFDGRVIEVDTGMLSSYYQGVGNALVIEGDDLSVVSEQGATLPDPSDHPRRVGLRPAGLDAGDIEQLLVSGRIVAERQDSSGRQIVTVSDGSVNLEAEFRRRAGRGFYPDVAAYRLDLLLGLDMVPEAVVREVGGNEGSLQFLPLDTTDEAQRRETGRGGSAWCPLPLQWDAMLIFDALIYNEARVATSILYNETNWQLILGGHSDTFSTRKDRPDHLKNVELTVSPGWRRALEALDDDTLMLRLGDVLDAKRLRALAARRDILLQLGAQSGR